MKRNPLIFLLFLLLLLFGAGFFSYSVLLPRYVEKKMLPDLGRQLSSSLNGQVYRLGFSAADFGDVILGDPLNPAVNVGTIHADYSLSSLLAGKLEQIRINGLILRLEVSDGRLIFPGIDLEKFTPQETGEKPQKDAPGMDLPVEVEKLQISNSRIELMYGRELFLLPFELQVLKEKAGDSQPVYNFSLQMLPLGEKVTLAGTIDLARNKSILTLVADSLDVRRFAFLMDGDGYDLMPGNVSIRGEAEIGLLPFEFLSANLTIDPGLMHFNNTPVRFGQTTPDAGHAIYLELMNDGKQMQVKAQSLISEPLSASLELNGSVVREQDDLQGSGNIVIRITEPTSNEKNVRLFRLLQSNPELRGDFTLAHNKSGTWRAELKSPVQKQPGRGVQVFQIKYDTISLQAGIPSFAVLGQGTAEADEFQVSLAIPNVQASSDGAVIRLPEAGLQATYNRKHDPDGGVTSSAALHIALGSLKFQKSGLSGKADISVQGKMAPQSINETKTLQAEGKITLTNAEITERDSAVKADGIEGNIPWSWPQTATKMAGEIKAPRIRWKNLDLGSLQADISLKDMTYFFNGKYRSALLKGFATKLSGKAAITDSAYYGELALQSDMTPFAAINLGKFALALDKSYLSGELGLDGSLQFDAGGLKGRMQVKVQNGTFEFPEKKYDIKGIDLSMLIPALPDLRTAPAQTLHFAEASIGNLAFTKGKLAWQLESMNSVFLEEAVVQWAGGRVFANAVRLSPDHEEFVVPIFCDRLRLTELLHQFGISNAEGEGTVNGRIPLQVGKKTIGFEDGFLYSSPGQGGSVKISAFDILAAGIPKNSPQYAQVDFAAEALKNFQYNWVKLILNTEGENLLMQMQMDGKPVQSLPFKYDNQTGLLQRIENTDQGIMQPIRLDVNFRLPLNRFLGYSGKIQDIMKKIK